MSELKLWFDHGLGDCVHFAHVCQLYKNRGDTIKLHYEVNKSLIWQAAAVTYVAIEGTRYHPWRYFPSFNSPVNNIDWSGNKIALNLNIESLPNIGEIDNLWEELHKVNLENSLEELVDQKVKDAMSAFLGDLPRPIILIHTSGTNMPGSKNLPNDQVEELYRILLTRTNASLVLLDWDFRVPLWNHGRIRHVKRDIGHISLEQLYSLIRHASLMIGVDSGPYHFMGLTQVPTLGVFHHHYPSCVGLARSKTINMTRNAASYKPINVSRRPRWNIIEYSGQMPNAEDIARHAMRIIEGGRYLKDPNKIGRDIMIQQWVRDWCHGSTGTSPFADRKYTMDFLLREISLRFSCPNIVETGCTRSAEDWGGAGNSTYIFGAYLDGRGCGHLTTVDIDQNHIDFCKENTTQWHKYIDYATSDSVAWLENYQNRIDVLYLDSMDVDIVGYEDHCLKEIKASEAKLSGRSLVIIDDTSWNNGWIGKGAKTVPYLTSNGWKVLCCGYQVVLSRDAKPIF